MTLTPERTHRPPAPSYRDAVSRLATAQKPGHGVPAYTRWPNRWLGRRLAAAAHVVGATPDQVTWASAAASLVGIVLVVAVPPSLWSAVVVTVLLLLGYALDSADGQLARLRGGGSPAGEWLDHVVDAVRLPLVHASLVVGFARWEGLPAWAPLVPLGFLVVAVVRFFAMMLTEQVLARAAAGRLRSEAPEPAAAGGRRPLLRSYVLLPVDFGVLALVFLLLASPLLLLLGYGLLFVINAAWLVLTLGRRYREVAALAAPSRGVS
ncbi:CDP-alcohol phosphatidyltransferase family protein [Aquipuribacter hungaricus]|uniref:CDP-alcohol phosphatidyltransferase family protein n=1 Tax=Aquipuribacter hungaricus TaxID=545624 RepID=A0ABV7WDB6_9MICO